MIEIGDSKGNFPPTPHDPPDPQQQQYSTIPNEAKEFAARMLKTYLQTMSDQEQEINKWVEDQQRVNVLFRGSKETFDGQMPEKISPISMTRKERQQLMGELNQKMMLTEKKISPSRSNNLLDDIKSFEREMNDNKIQLIQNQHLRSPSNQSYIDLNQIKELHMKKSQDRYFTSTQEEQQEDASILKQFIRKNSPNYRDISSIMLNESQSTFQDPNLMSMAKSQSNNRFAHQAEQKRLDSQKEFFDKIQNNPILARYASKEVIGEQGVNGSLEKKKSNLNHELMSLGSRSVLSQDHEFPHSEHGNPDGGHAHRASFVDQYKEAKKKGKNYIDQNDFRKKMIEAGYKPRVLLRSTSTRISPRPKQSKFYDRLHNQKADNSRMAEELSRKRSEDEMKECTFSPDLNLSRSKKYRKNAKSPHPESKQTPLLHKGKAQMEVKGPAPFNDRSISPNPARKTSGTFDRLYEDGKIKEERRIKEQIKKLEEEQRRIPFKPNRDQTKKQDSKYNMKKSPERLEKYYQDYVDRNKRNRSKGAPPQPLDPSMIPSPIQPSLEQQYSREKELKMAKQESMLHQAAKKRAHAQSCYDYQPKSRQGRSSPKNQEDLEKKKKRLEDFHQRTKEFQKKKEDKIKEIISHREQINRNQSASRKGSSLVIQEHDVKVVEYNDNEYLDSSRAYQAAERLYNQGKELTNRKDEYALRKQLEEYEKIGKPEINDKTNKILEQKQKRTGMSYVNPFKRQRSMEKSDKSIGEINPKSAYTSSMYDKMQTPSDKTYSTLSQNTPEKMPSQKHMAPKFGINNRSPQRMNQESGHYQSAQKCTLPKNLASARKGSKGRLTNK